MTPRRILLADDHALFLEGLRSLLEHHPVNQIVGLARNGHQAIQRARETRPDVVVMDISMPELNGIDATRRILSEVMRCRILCVSMHTESQFVSAAFRAGASGYLVKDCAFDELDRALGIVLAGRFYLSPGVADIAVEALRSQAVSADSVFLGLSGREREVLQLLAEGYSSRETADALCISTKTVHTHRQNMMAKLQIRSVAGLIKYAIREGLSSAESLGP